MILCISENINHDLYPLRMHRSNRGFFIYNGSQFHACNERVLRGSNPQGCLVMGYFEISAPQVRTESNRVNYNITSKSGQPLAIGPGPRYGDVKVMPIRDKDKCN